MSHVRRKPELLAPVGSPDALIAAVRCGADAVYLGAGRFHARQHTQPFDDTALEEAVSYCHAHGVQVHLALNTLIAEQEMEQALALAHRAAELSVDALIVQDRGLAAAIRRAAPGLALHASTQLTCHTPEGVKKLAQDGFSRVVLAREMTREEIRECVGLGPEIEVFVHGALCMSVSGQCLLSAMLGGRSGNRGQCAQPCRLPFSLDGRGQACDLSLKDNSLVQHIPELAAMGVDSLKIEGRMKRPEYVAAAVSVCRAMIDGTPLDDILLSDLRSVFSRSGFTDGYYIGQRDRTMFGTRTKDDVTAAPAANKRLQALYAKETPRVAVDMCLTVREQEPMTLAVTDETGLAVCVTGEMPRQSERPLSEERMTEALRKLGGTPFLARDITVHRDATADTPLSAINGLRREAVQALQAKRSHREPVLFKATPPAPFIPVPVPSKAAVVVRLANGAQWSPALAKTADLTVLPLTTSPGQWQQASAAGRVAVEVPPGLFSSGDVVLKRLRVAAENGAVAAMVHNVGALPLCEKAGLPVIGGYGLHTTNRETLLCHVKDGLCAATLSPELSRFLSWTQETPLPLGTIGYGRLPLMLLRNCPAKAAKGCRDCRQNRTLTDRKGKRFLLMCDNGCARLFNSVPLYTADLRGGYDGLAFVLLYMTDESPERAAEITGWVASGHAPRAEEAFPGGFTRGIKSI